MSEKIRLNWLLSVGWLHYTHFENKKKNGNVYEQHGFKKWYLGKKSIVRFFFKLFVHLFIYKKEKKLHRIIHY